MKAKTILIKNKEYRISDLALAGCLLFSYFCFFISTMLRIEPLILFFSPLTAILTGSLIIKCLSRMGSFWLPSFVLSLGIFTWALSNLLILFNTYFF